MNKSFVIDNSIVMSWCFKDEVSQYADSILDSLEYCTAIVPSIWPLEVGNVLLIAERKKRLSRADSTRFITLLSELPITIDQETPERMIKEIFALGREHKLSTHNASYLDLAMKKGIPIATLDNRLLTAAKQSNVSIMTG